MKHKYISEFSQRTQIAIERDLREVLNNQEDVELAMNSRLIDLEDTIKISTYI